MDSTFTFSVPKDFDIVTIKPQLSQNVAIIQRNVDKAEELGRCNYKILTHLKPLLTFGEIFSGKQRCLPEYTEDEESQRQRLAQESTLFSPMLPPLRRMIELVESLDHTPCDPIWDGAPELPKLNDLDFHLKGLKRFLHWAMDGATVKQDKLIEIHCKLLKHALDAINTMTVGYEILGRVNLRGKIGRGLWVMPEVSLGQQGFALASHKALASPKALHSPSKTMSEKGTAQRGPHGLPGVQDAACTGIHAAASSALSPPRRISSPKDRKAKGKRKPTHPADINPWKGMNLQFRPTLPTTANEEGLIANDDQDVSAQAKDPLQSKPQDFVVSEEILPEETGICVNQPAKGLILTVTAQTGELDCLKEADSNLHTPCVLTEISHKCGNQKVIDDAKEPAPEGGELGGEWIDAAASTILQETFSSMDGIAEVLETAENSESEISVFGLAELEEVNSVMAERGPEEEEEEEEEDSMWGEEVKLLKEQIAQLGSTIECLERRMARKANKPPTTKRVSMEVPNLVVGGLLVLGIGWLAGRYL
jgi:hypothetical protein